MPGDKKGACVKCKKGKNRKLNEKGVCYFECLRGQDGGAHDNSSNNNNNNTKQATPTLAVSEREDSQATLCGKCNNIVKDEAASMQCEACFTWFHLKPCCNIDRTKYKALEENDLLSVIRWFCNKCDKSILKFSSELAEIKERLCALEHKSSSSSEVKVAMKEVVHDHFTEQSDLDRRKCNVIVHGLPEPASETEGTDGESRTATTQEKRDADIAKFVSIGVDAPVCRVTQEDILTTFRLGAPRDDGKPRPVCVKLSNADTRRRLLTNAKTLRHSSTQWHKSIYVNPDLTVVQRQQDRAAREELRRRRQDGEQNLTIRNFKVITDTRRNLNSHQT